MSSAAPPFIDDRVFTPAFARNTGFAAVFFFIVQYLVFFLLRLRFPDHNNNNKEKRTERVASIKFSAQSLRVGQTHDQYLKLVASCSVALVYHSLASPVAVWQTLQLVRNAPDPASLLMKQPDSDAYTAAGVGHIHHNLQLLSEVFIGYISSAIVYFALGWEEGLSVLLHHFTFLAICVISSNNNFIVGGACLVMELSSPALNLHFICRPLASKRAQELSELSVKVFAFLFFICRIVLYGSAVLTLMYILATVDLPPINKPKYALCTTLFGIGLALQIKWQLEIYQKAARQRKRNELKKQQHQLND